MATPTHFNSKLFDGFISEQEAETISDAIGLKELDNHHGTTFYRCERGVLYITYKLKQNMTQCEISEGINKYFWFEKESKAGNLDKISGRIIHPPMEDEKEENQREPDGHLTYGQPSGNLDDTKELKIDGCNYEISEQEICRWVELYGEIKSEIKEVATQNEQGGSPVGTGSYTLKVKLKRAIPHILPINVLRVKCTYSGVKKQCKNCYEYHKESKTGEFSNKKTYKCEKKSYDQYVELFKQNNPRIVRIILNYRKEKEESREQEEIKSEYTGDTDTDCDVIDYSFNYENNAKH